MKPAKEEPITTKTSNPTVKGEIPRALARFSLSTTSEVGTSPRLLMLSA